jgi:hypothetical protein
VCVYAGMVESKICIRQTLAAPNEAFTLVNAFFLFFADPTSKDTSMHDIFMMGRSISEAERVGLVSVVASLIEEPLPEDFKVWNSVAVSSEAIIRGILWSNDEMKEGSDKGGGW